MGNLFVRMFGGLLVAFFVVTSAHAQTTEQRPAEIVPGTDCAWTSLTSACTPGMNRTREQACIQSGGTGTYTVYNNCNGTTPWPGVVLQRTITPQTYKCPPGQGWTLSGQTCTRPACPNGRLPDGTCDVPCQLGWEKDAQGVCRKDCTNRQGRALLDDIYDTDENGEGQYDDCKVKCEKVTEYMSVSLGGEEHEFHSSMRCKYTGASAQDNDKDMGSTGRKSAAKAPNKPNCEFQPKLDSDSSRNWTAIPAQTGH